MPEHTPVTPMRRSHTGPELPDLRPAPTTLHAGRSLFGAATVALAGLLGLATFSPSVLASSVATTLTLSSSANPAVQGNSVTLTATLTAPDQPATTTAGTVYGQDGSFTTDSSDDTATTLDDPHNTLVDPDGGLYVADEGNSRVLYYPAGSTTPTRVYGQGGSFTTGSCNEDGVSANSLCYPHGLALDSEGNLYVADSGNDRILMYPSGSTTATEVWGQGGSFTSNGGGTTASSFQYPLGVAVDSAGDVYVLDTDNSRVLYFPEGTTTATVVYGQGGSFTTSNYGNTATSFDHPEALALGPSDTLYVADSDNNRVLSFAEGSTTPTDVWGQGGSFTTDVSGTTATTLDHPNGVVVDSDGDVYISDGRNNRILFFPEGSTTATAVYGQGGSFTTGTANNGGISATSLSYPHGLSLGPDNTLYCADHNNSRVLTFPGVVPTGSVTFTNGSERLAVEPLLGDPTATYTTSNLPAGTDDITASYSGDANFAASTTAAPLAQVITSTAVPVPATGAGLAGTAGTMLLFLGAGVLLLGGTSRRRRFPVS